MNKKIIIASKNPVKIEAVSTGFEVMFPQEIFDCEGAAIPSGVSDQPLSDGETFQGAMNRAKNARAHFPSAHFWVGIEGGLAKMEQEMCAFAWVVILGNEKIGKAKTGTFFLPQKITELIEQGMELGEADDLVFGQSNSKQKNGAVGILTGDVIDRSKYYTEAVVLALIPFRNKELF